MGKRTEDEQHPIEPAALAPAGIDGPTKTEQALIVYEKMQELFLPIHGHVELYRDELAVIDHPAFQRLRRVKQLGLAHMVFPGATHTRFEHSIGAVHVAQLIIQHVNKNHETGRIKQGRWATVGINDETARFIRLGALLHDVGHLPLGHTLEDELNHLRSHDGPERLERVARIPYEAHDVDYALVPPTEKPVGGWTLKGLGDRLYAEHASRLGLAGIAAFSILSHIVCKPPKPDGPAQTAWQEEETRIKLNLWLEMCRDIVGNTICADFLDYLYRDWHHLGKPLYYDKRLFQYMEVRRQTDPAGDPQFVINVGEPEKVRHDALTDILELLNARYKLAETVLFHRAKLALTGLLDRCLLEIADLYEGMGRSIDEFKSKAEDLLLSASDDGLHHILETLVAEAGDQEMKLSEAIAEEEEVIERAVSPQRPLLEEGAIAGRKPQGLLGARRALIQELISKLRDREVYTLAYKLRMADFTAPHGPENPRLRALLDIYRVPEKRLAYLRMTEAACGFTRGSLTINCPPDPAMNAKIAEVKLFLDDEITPFAKYENASGTEASLTRGALTAQVGRFHELWAASVFINRRLWDGLDTAEREHLRSVLKKFFFQMDTREDPTVSRAQMQASLEVLRKKASRSGTTDPATHEYQGADFPSGIPFGHSGEK